MPKKLVITKILEDCDSCVYGCLYMAAKTDNRSAMACCYPTSLNIPNFIEYVNNGGKKAPTKIPAWCPLSDVS